MSSCVGDWDQLFFVLTVVDDVKFPPPDDKFWKGYAVRGVILFVQIKNGDCSEAPVDEAENNPYGVLVTKTP